MKLLNSTLLLAFLFVLSIQLNAQNIKGIIINSDTDKPVPFANISLASTKQGVTTDFNGNFQINAQINDSLIISSVGYHTITHALKNNEFQKILLPPHSYYLSEVKVKSEDDIPMMYQSRVFPSEEPGVGAAIVSPFSFWYYKLSKKEKSRRKIRNQIDFERQMAKVMRIYNKQLVAEFTGLTGPALDSCFTYCNKHINLTEEDDEFTVKFKLLEVLTNYKSQD